MRIEDGLKLDFADVLIRPKRSSLGSRNEVSLERKINFRHGVKSWTGFPIVASNMDTIGTPAMARELSKVSGLTALSKYLPVAEIASLLKGQYSDSVFVTIGTTDDDYKKLGSLKSKAPIQKICIDVANGYTEAFVSYLRTIRDENPHAVVMAGNVVTGDMVEALVLAGADIVKVGIGSGSVCTTRRVTGVGYPQLSAIIECADAAHGLGAHICSDGGCTTSGDVAKAFGGGADFVMLGGMLAGHAECAGTLRYATQKGKRTAIAMRFYGMSSDTAMKKYSGGVAPYRASEGKSVEVPYRGKVSDTLAEIMGGVRSAMTYIGARALKELPKRTTFVQVSRQLNDVFGK